MPENKLNTIELIGLKTSAEMAAEFGVFGTNDGSINNISRNARPGNERWLLISSVFLAERNVARRPF